MGSVIYRGLAIPWIYSGFDMFRQQFTTFGHKYTSNQQQTRPHKGEIEKLDHHGDQIMFFVNLKSS